MTATIQQYWNDRAASNRDSAAATTNDIHLRELEGRTLIREIAQLALPPGARILDLGCGDGRTTMRVAERLPSAQFVGIDYAAVMIDNATASLSNRQGLAQRVRFAVGDVTDSVSMISKERFDAAFSCRCLINLEDEAMQRKALANIAAALVPGGRFFAIENFMEGHDGMNRARAAVSLPAIPVRWHNRFFTENALHEATRGVFTIDRIDDFASAYYFATRVIYSKMCLMRSEEPDYDHDIHRLAVDLPPIGCFSPVRLAVLIRT